MSPVNTSSRPARRLASRRALDFWTGKFLCSVGVILFLTGTIKLIDALGNEPGLSRPDPIVGLATGQLYFLVGFAELALAIWLWETDDHDLGLICVVCIVLAFAAYRAAQFIARVPSPCGCLGLATNWVPLDKAGREALLRLLLGYMVVVSMGLIALGHTLRGVCGNGLDDANARSALNLAPP